MAAKPTEPRTRIRARRRPVSAPMPDFPATPAASPALALPEPRGAWRAFALGLAFVQPWTGAVFALLYWPSPEGPARRFSRWCFGLALAGAVLGLMALGLWSALVAGSAGVQPW